MTIDAERWLMILQQIEQNQVEARRLATEALQRPGRGRPRVDASSPAAE